MKKVVVIPDSFKGTISSQRICDIIEAVFKKKIPNCEVISVPLADGGEGSVEIFLQVFGGQKIPTRVTGPDFKQIDSFFAILSDGTAVIEMAAAAGLPLVRENYIPKGATTFGVGELLIHALNRGCRKVVIGLGGSATTDGGIGLASALGVKFLDKKGNPVSPNGEGLFHIQSIDISGIDSRISECEIIAMSDVDNPLYGLQGAAHIFAPQKGADEEAVEFLDTGLRHLDNIIQRDLSVEIANIKGAGAAGGLGAGLIAFTNAKIQMGIEAVLDMISFEEIIRSADLIITGEGCLDAQSLRGKAVIGVSTRAKKQGIPVIAIVGESRIKLEEAHPYGIGAIFTINRLAIPFSESRNHTEENIIETVENILSFARFPLASI